MVTPFIFPRRHWLIMRASQGCTAPVYSTLKTSEVKCQTFESFYWVEELFGVVNITYWKHIKNVFIFLAESTLMVSSKTDGCVLDAGEQFFAARLQYPCYPWSYVKKPKEVYQENKCISDNMPGNQDFWLTYRKVCSIAYGKN